MPRGWSACPGGAPLEWAARTSAEKPDVMRRVLNIDVPLADACRLEVLASGLALYKGA